MNPCMYRTDPACRIAQWDFSRIQEMLIKKQGVDDEGAADTEVTKYVLILLICGVHMSSVLTLLTCIDGMRVCIVCE